MCCTHFYPSVLMLILSGKQPKIVSSIIAIEILASSQSDPVREQIFVYFTVRIIFIYLGRSLSLSMYEALGGIQVEKKSQPLNQIN